MKGMRDRHEWYGQEGYRKVRIDRKRTCRKDREEKEDGKEVRQGRRYMRRIDRRRKDRRRIDKIEK